MNTIIIPELSSNERNQYFDEAKKSERSRAPKILHKQGSYYNSVFNFILEDSYMHPHLHPSNEKVEKMYLIEGSFALFIFDDKGKICQTHRLEKGGRESIDVPPFTWHTYVMLTQKVIVFETMNGIYDPASWKEMASWAPFENTSEASSYLAILKNEAKL